MATKYIIEGAAFCGDGTASNEAASGGAVGAWNNINVLEGSAPAFGVLAAGDHVNIRSKTSAGANIQRSIGANVNVGSSAGTANAPITWLLDDGTIWSGVDGTLEWLSSGASRPTFLANNIVASKKQGSMIVRNSASAPAASLLAVISGYVKNVKFDWTAKANTNRCYLQLAAQGVLDSPIVKWGLLGEVGSAYALIAGAYYTAGQDFLVINPDIELQNATPGRPLFGGAENNASGHYTVIGGRVWGAGAINGQVVFSFGAGGASGAIHRAIGFEFPRAMPLYDGLPAVGATYEAIACESGGGGGELVARWGSASSRLDNNPPSLAGALPNSTSTPWAWRIWPRFTDLTNLLRMVSAKLYTGDPAVKTITQELLVANTMAPTKRSLWLVVNYIDDSTGATKTITSQDFAGGALATSTANWSATVWGLVTFDKRKIAVTTPTAVKKDTMIEVVLMGYDKSATANDIYMMDPDFGIN